MIAPTHTLPWQGTMAGFRKFSVLEYHKLIEIGVLTEDDNLELLEGYLVHKMTRNPPHDWVIQRLNRLFVTLLPTGWDVRIQSAITLSDSEPEPDVAIVKDDEMIYRTNHPSPDEVGLVIEVADSTLVGDRIDKGRIYARANLPIYWIVNLVDRRIEAYENPTGPTATPAYGKRTDLHEGDSLPLILDGKVVTTLAVKDLLP